MFNAPITAVTRRLKRLSAQRSASHPLYDWSTAGLPETSAYTQDWSTYSPSPSTLVASPMTQAVPSTPFGGYSLPSSVFGTPNGLLPITATYGSDSDSMLQSPHLSISSRTRPLLTDYEHIPDIPLLNSLPGEVTALSHIRPLFTPERYVV
ncbi:hypothetical protein CTheo_9209 [Ceratobasidium theobromae]|uniref:Uncharacterized protein n=1 Tax=Ceratobasidium theobromae TaxID=1582974 RepID=A0A5N5Q7F8_9AGAM|nr:hypothetical protein CTheo_9209 [Ceratobasidium theobromae]